MKRELMVFENGEFGNVRVVLVGNKEYFDANEVAKILGYANPRDAIRRHCKGVVEHDTLKNGGGYPIKLIPEGDLYRLIIGSQLPSAEKFEKWIFDEVLPSIRKTGGYISNSELMVNTYFGNLDSDSKTIIMGLFNNIEAQQKQILALQDNNIILNDENSLLSEKVLKWADRNFVNAVVRKYGASMGNGFGDAWNEFKKELLYKHSINLNQRVTNYLNKTGKKTKPKTLDMLHNDEVQKAVSTAVGMCRDRNVDIGDLIRKLKEDKNIA